MAKTGRPPKYATAEQMQAAIDRYFEDCKGEPIIGDDGFPICDKWGKPFIIHQRPPTVTGLALALGFTSRQALLDYQAKKEFVDTVTRAKSRIEAYAEERLFDRDGQRRGIQPEIQFPMGRREEGRQQRERVRCCRAARGAAASAGGRGDSRVTKSSAAWPS